MWWRCTIGFALVACSDRTVDGGKDGSASGGSEGVGTTTASTSTSGTTPVDTGEAVDDGAPAFDLGPRLDVGAVLDAGASACGEAPDRLTPVCGSAYGGDGPKLSIVCADPGELIECPAADSAWARERTLVCECFLGDPVDGPVCGPIADDLGACCYWFYDDACPPDATRPTRRRR